MGGSVADNLSSRAKPIRGTLPHQIAEELAQEQRQDPTPPEPRFKPGMMSKEELSRLMPMAMACCQALGWDFKRQDNAGKQALFDLARDWLEMGDTPDTVPGFLEWFQKQHPGWGNPHPKQFRQEWPEYAKTLRGRGVKTQPDADAVKARSRENLFKQAEALGIRPPPGGT